MSELSNYTYDEMSVGQKASYTRSVSERDIQLFAAVSGDVNPVHLDEEFAATTQFKQRIAHGMLTGAFVSAAIALELPGPGTIYLGQSLRFRRPVVIGDELTVQLEITEKKDERKFITLDCTIVNQNGDVVASGTAEVMAPAEKMTLPAPELPPISVG